MNPLKKNIFLIMLFAFLISSSCSKKDDNNTTPNNTFNPQVKIDYLTTGNWKLKSLTITPGLVRRTGETVTNLMSELSSWNLDNTRLFISNGSGLIDEGPTKFSQTDPQIIPLLWTLNSDQTKITITILYSSNTITTTYDLVQLDASSLKYSISEDGSKVADGKPGTTYVTTFTWGH